LIELSKKASLKEFIDDNYHLIAAMGVTAAFFALSSRLEQGESLAVISLLMLGLLDWELLAKMPSPNEASLRLIVFGFLVQMLLVYAGLYVFAFYLEEFIYFLPALFAVLLILRLFKSERFVRFLAKFPAVTKAQVLKYIIMSAAAMFAGMVIAALIREIILRLV